MNSGKKGKGRRSEDRKAKGTGSGKGEGPKANGNGWNAENGPGAKGPGLEGWQRMATYSEPRLSEMVEEYRELGFEVRLEDAVADDECAECIKLEPESLKTIYVRKKMEQRD